MSGTFNAEEFDKFLSEAPKLSNVVLYAPIDERSFIGKFIKEWKPRKRNIKHAIMALRHRVKEVNGSIKFSQFSADGKVEKHQQMKNVYLDAIQDLEMLLKLYY